MTELMKLVMCQAASGSTATCGEPVAGALILAGIWRRSHAAMARNLTMSVQVVESPLASPWTVR